MHNGGGVPQFLRCLSSVLQFESRAEIVRWSIFWLFLMIGFTVTSKAKLDNTKYIAWVKVDIALGLIATILMQMFAQRSSGVVLFFVGVHALWWVSGLFWTVSDGSFAFVYFFRHPWASNIPVLWFLDGIMVVRQLNCQMSGQLPDRIVDVPVDVQRSKELIRWSFLWLYYMSFVFTYFAVVDYSRNFVRWLVTEWAIMLLSTCLMMKMTAVTQNQQNATVWRRAFFAIAFLHILWWIAGLARRTKSTHEYEIIHAEEHPAKSTIPFLWIMDGIFVLGQPYCQWKFVRARQTVHELTVDLLVQ